MPLKLVLAVLLVLVAAVFDGWHVVSPVPRLTSQEMSLLFCVVEAVVGIGLLARQEWARMLLPLVAALNLLAAVMWVSILAKSKGPAGPVDVDPLIAWIGLGGLLALYLPWCSWQEDVKRWSQARPG